MVKGGLFGWLESSLGLCGWAENTNRQKWVRATPDLFPREVPGMTEDVLEELRLAGGSLESKIQRVSNIFRGNARHLEGLQQVLIRSVLRDGGPELPQQVRDVLTKGTYTDAFLNAFDGHVFPIHAKEVAPYHEFQLAMEVRAGGKYWAGSAGVQDDETQQKIETIGYSADEAVSLGGERGAVFVWRWVHFPDRGPYDLPAWLTGALAGEGPDPERKLQNELDVVDRWIQQLRQETADYVRKGPELKDPYIREVLRLWPSEMDIHQRQQLKKCAWIEGLEPEMFVGRKVLVACVSYDASHAMALGAIISKRHQEEPAQEGDPPYKLTSTWQWTPLENAKESEKPAEGVADAEAQEADAISGKLGYFPEDDSR